MDTFYPARSPSLSGTSMDRAARNITSNFGDSYTQDTPDGLNPVVATLMLSWSQLFPAEADDIDAFLAVHTSRAFFYQLPGSASALIWIPGKWTRGYVSATWHSMAVTLSQRFNSTSS